MPIFDDTVLPSDQALKRNYGFDLADY